MSRLTAAFCVAGLLLLGPMAMGAQDPGYDDNALRVESHRGDLQIVRGLQGTVVARSGVFRGPKVASLVSRSENALVEARIFERDYGRGQYVAALGIATLGAAIGASRIPDINTAIPSGLTAASILLVGYGGAQLERAHKALSKAVWWYNRDLNRH